MKLMEVHFTQLELPQHADARLHRRGMMSVYGQHVCEFFFLLKLCILTCL